MKKIFALLLLALTACYDQAPNVISPAELKKDALILDVRTPEEHQTVSLAQEHWLVPLNQLDAKKFVREHRLDASTPLYILCRSGKRALVAAQKFKDAGFKNAIVIQGGIIAAEKSGLPVKK